MTRSLVLLAALALAGCADKTIRLAYTPPPPSLTVGPRLMIIQFADQRGNEGDHGDLLRIGGIYGGYGNRVARVMASEPWPPTFLAALVSEFRAQGIDAIGVEHPAAELSANTFWLEGDLRNFSTEARWGHRAHISAIVRLRGPGGTQLIQKKIEVAEEGYHWNNFDASILQDLMNKAFADFVRKVATDPEIRALLPR